MVHIAAIYKDLMLGISSLMKFSYNIIYVCKPDTSKSSSFSIGMLMGIIHGSTYGDCVLRQIEIFTS